MKPVTQVFGIHAVRAVLNRRPAEVSRLLLASGRQDARVEELRQLAAKHKVTVSQRPMAELDQASGGAVHQGALAEVQASEPMSEGGLFDLLTAATTPPLLLVLDGVTDPHNLGACLRTADAAGVMAVVAPRDRAVGLTPVVRKVAAGAAETVPFVQVTNLARSLRELKDAGLWIVGTEGEAERDIYAAELTGPMALVLGAEGAGMRRLTRECCDLTVRLPMMGAVESLNVSVAAGVLLYEALRQRTRQV